MATSTGRKSDHFLELREVKHEIDVKFYPESIGRFPDGWVCLHKTQYCCPSEAHTVGATIPVHDEY
jgi:hypothetical protein